MHHPTSRRYPKLALSAMLAMCSLAVCSSHAALTDLTARNLLGWVEARPAEPAKPLAGVSTL